MKNPRSLISVLFLMLVALIIRVSETNMHPDRPFCITRWDAFGYYMYNPAIFLYNDYKELNWLDTIDAQYQMTGGDGWQAQKEANGNYVFKYLGGISMMQFPFFVIGHVIAKCTAYPADGFSAPYQYALSFGALLYCFLALLLLRTVLLRYFKDDIAAVTLLFLMLASNIFQYAAIDNGLSHVYIFFLYALVLYATIKWHEKPSIVRAFFIGWIIGLATISRPTEAIMLFIPLLWNMQNKAAAKEKWALVGRNKSHVLIIIVGGLIGVLPQLLYWKSASGSFVYDVGSKWHFLDPFFRVLVGWEKGWFIYTPITIFFIIGMFFMKKFPFQKSVVWFCLLNIWIVTAWDDWRYGGSYSTRALSQSYPVFALAFAALIDRVIASKARILFYAIGIYLSVVNLFQLWQYNTTVLHFNDMNRKYYSRIYLNPNPSPLDMSLLDTDEWIDNEEAYQHKLVTQFDALSKLAVDSVNIFHQPLNLDTTKENWLKVEATIEGKNLWGKRLEMVLNGGDSVKKTSIRLSNPIGEKTHLYTAYLKVPGRFSTARMDVFISPEQDRSVRIMRLKLELLNK